MIGFNVTTRRTGRFWSTANWRGVIHRWGNDVQEEGAEFALSHVRRTHATHFKHPTGYYQSLVRIRNDGRGPYVGDDGHVPYGPWLEGVESRNNTTRFRGYHAFRNAAIALDRRLGRIGEQLMDRRYLDDLA